MEKLDYLNSREDLAAIKIFSDIHGKKKLKQQKLDFLNLFS